MSNKAIQLRIYVEQGMEHFERGETEEAYVWWNRALQLDPQNTQIRQMLERLPPRRIAPPVSSIPPLPSLPHSPSSPSPRPIPSSPNPGFRSLQAAELPSPFATDYLNSSSPSQSPPSPQTRIPQTRPLPPEALLTPHPSGSLSHRTEEEIGEVWLPQEDDLSWEPPASPIPRPPHPPHASRAPSPPPPLRVSLSSPPPSAPSALPASPGRFSPPPISKPSSSFPPASPSGAASAPLARRPVPPPLPSQPGPSQPPPPVSTPSEIFELRRVPPQSGARPSQAPAQSLNALSSKTPPFTPSSPPSSSPSSPSSFPPSSPSYPSAPSIPASPAAIHSIQETPEDTQILLSTARELLQASDLEGALELVEIILKRDPKHPEAGAILKRSQSQLTTFYLRSIGSLQARPSMQCSFDQILHHNLNHREGFLLSQIDGRTSIVDLMMLSGMSEFAILKLLHRLILQGILKV